MKYFTIKELCASATARRLGIDNTPTEDVTRNLTALTEAVLDPLRAAWGRPITVNSGYRCPALNTAVKGAASSQHLRGCAADISAGSTSDNRKLMDLCARLGLPYDQLIDEYGYRWIHVSYVTDRTPRRQVLHLT